MNIRRLVLASVLTVLVTVSAVGVASAHQGWIIRSWGKAGTYEDHHHIDSCDLAVDGHMVRARFHLYGVVSEYAGSWDPDGGGGQCAHDPDLWTEIVDHRVCAEVIGCSPSEYH